MKLSQPAIQVLRNFSTINPSIQFQKGNVLKTISPNKNMMAKAILDENIPSTFAIYDLSRFLGVVSLFDSPAFEIGEKMVSIQSPGRRVNYTFADPSTIVTPPTKEINIGIADVEFELKQENFAEIMKALGVMSFPDLCIVGEDGKVILRATDTKNPSSDKYDIEVGETDVNFVAVFKTENLKIIPNTYQVEITSKGISHFKSDSVEYWIAIESNSKFD
jgi:hypothetical protein